MTETPPRPPRRSPAPVARHGHLGRMVEHPAPTPDDGRTVPPVLDPDDGRIVARPGWLNCLRCRKRIWSKDRRHLRLCDICRRAPLASNPLGV
ncbi:MAG TPA: hypothetical protein VFO41_08720 [Alphaproteobacteria bacterium]|nr:hypothetical protein [Alphaproteobacteria bacterium]